MPLQRPNLALSEEYTQLALGLELPEVELEGMPAEEARLRSEAGRSALLALKGAPEQPQWFIRFEMLTNYGWPWRQATYIAWASMPKDGRKPESQEELAKQFLRLNSDRAISTWRKKNPAIDAWVAVMQSAELWEHRADSFKNLIEGMRRSGTDYKFFNHLKLYMEMTGDYVPLTQLAALLKRKADDGPKGAAEEVLDELAAGVQELEGMMYGDGRNILRPDVPPATEEDGDAADGE